MKPEFPWAKALIGSLLVPLVCFTLIWAMPGSDILADTAATTLSMAAADPAATQEAAASTLIRSADAAEEITLTDRILSFFGLFGLLGIAYLMSNNRKAINWKLVGWGCTLQMSFGVLVMLTQFGKDIFEVINKVFMKLLEFSDKGANFLFGALAPLEGQDMPVGVVFATKVLPTIIFFSSLMAILYHLGVMQFFVRWISRIMEKTMKTSGAETMSASANIFVGQTEAPLVIKPYLENMTKSELMVVMVGGFATIAGGVLALYVSMLKHIPGIAGHLASASVMSAPAALVIAKILYPETEVAETAGGAEVKVSKVDQNTIEAAARGASEGVMLLINVAAMLVAFVALVHFADYLIISLGNLLGLDISFTILLSWCFRPIALLMGIPWHESGQAGLLLGEKLVLTEFMAYLHLSEMPELSYRTSVILSYGLCGFANFASIGIQLGGIGAIAPSRRKDLASIGFKAMIGGSLAAFMTGNIAGMLLGL
jgi:CNT family concentrative nucleoside transporter